MGGWVFCQNILMEKVSAAVILPSLEHAGAHVSIKLLCRSGKGNFHLTTRILKCFSTYKMEIEF